MLKPQAHKEMDAIPSRPYLNTQLWDDELNMTRLDIEILMVFMFFLRFVNTKLCKSIISIQINTVSNVSLVNCILEVS